MISRGHSVSVLSLDSGVATHAELPKVEYRAFNGALGRYSYAPALRRWLAVNAQHFDVAIVHGLWQYHGRAALRSLAGVLPYCVYAHGMLDPWFNRRYPLKYIKKLPYWLLNERRLLAQAHRVLFTCEEESRLARESFPLGSWTPAVCSLGIAGSPWSREVAVAALRREVANLPDTGFLLFLGRLHEKKGIDLLIESYGQFARGGLPPLVIAGPDEQGLKARLVARAAALGISERIIWTGMLQGPAKWGALMAAEAFVLPSHQENFGIAVVEALSVGTPVLISNKVNIWREIIADGAGLVAADTIDGTSDLLRQWQTRAPDVRASMQTQAVESFARRFEIEAATDHLLGVLDGAVRRPASRA